MEKLICNLCAGSPEIQLYNIKLSDEQKKMLNKNTDITADLCIGKEIKQLINNGVITYGCCCGHGTSNPTCLVNIESKSILNDLGYILHEYSEDHTKRGIYEINLKTNVQMELRKVLSNKVFKYLKQ